MLMRIDAHAAADIQRADALGRIELMAGERQHIDAQLVHVNRHRADSLHRIRVEEDIVRPGDLRNFRNRLNGADFVVGKHDRNENRLIGNRLFNVGRVHAAVFVDRQVRHLKAVLLEPAARMQHGVMLDNRGNDMVAFFLMRESRALDGPVIALGTAAGEINFILICADRRGNLLAGVIERLVRLAPVIVNG